MRYTSDPANLISPTERTIRHIARREGLGELSDDELDFVWDLLAKTAGAEVRDFDEAEAQAEAVAHAVGEAQAFAARYGTGDVFDDAPLLSGFERDYHAMQHQRHETLMQVDLNRMPGYNKPTQAVRLLWLFRTVQRLWVLFIIYVGSSSFIERLAAAFDAVNALTDAQLEMLEMFAGGDEPREGALMLGLELSVSGIQVAEMLRVARVLDEVAELQGRDQVTPDANGEEVHLRDIQGLEELGKVTPDAFALPKRLRWQRALSGELNVRNPHTRRAQKQLLFMAVDGSGSMRGSRQLGASRAAGVVVNRLEAVIAGDAELYLRFFDSRLREEEFHADSPESARELMRVISDPNQYLGSSTEFASTLSAASRRADEVLRSRNLRDPEIAFVTDGEARVPGLSSLGGTTLHTFQVGVNENLELSDLARQSGGVGIYLALQDWEAA